jgi:HlyD family secretion protein
MTFASLPRLLAFLAATALALPALAQEDPATPEPGPVAAPAISVATVAEATLVDRIFASGTIEPVEQVTVAPQVEGLQIETLLADVGDRVEAGQVLAQLADDQLLLQMTQLEASKASAGASIAQAEASLTEARSAAAEAIRVRDRTETLRADGTVSQAAADQARTGAESALARVTAAEQGLAAARAQVSLVEAQIADVDLRLARTQITATVGGIITERNAQIGAIASAAGAPMFVLIRDGLLELQADVAEQDVLRMAVGQPVTLNAVGLAQTLSGHVRLVDPTVGAATRLGRVRIALDTPEAVRAGLFAEAEIQVAERTGLAVPISAVSTGAGESGYVLRVDAEGAVEQVEVVTGIRDEGLVEIRSGLNIGDTLVARAGAFVRPGDVITPVPVETAAPASN